MEASQNTLIFNASFFKEQIFHYHTRQEINNLYKFILYNYELAPQYDTWNSSITEKMALAPEKVFIGSIKEWSEENQKITQLCQKSLADWVDLLPEKVCDDLKNQNTLNFFLCHESSLSLHQLTSLYLNIIEKNSFKDVKRDSLNFPIGTLYNPLKNSKEEPSSLSKETLKKVTNFLNTNPFLMDESTQNRVLEKKYLQEKTLHENRQLALKSLFELIFHGEISYYPAMSLFYKVLDVDVSAPFNKGDLTMQALNKWSIQKYRLFRIYKETLSILMDTLPVNKLEETKSKELGLIFSSMHSGNLLASELENIFKEVVLRKPNFIRKKVYNKIIKRMPNPLAIKRETVEAPAPSHYYISRPSLMQAYHISTLSLDENSESFFSLLLPKPFSLLKEIREKIINFPLGRISRRRRQETLKRNEKEKEKEPSSKRPRLEIMENRDKEKEKEK